MFHRSQRLRMPLLRGPLALVGFFAVSLVFIAPASAQGTDLKVSANGRYLEKKADGKPFLWVGDLNFTEIRGIGFHTHDSVAFNYLKDRKKEGYTVIETHYLTNTPGHKNFYGEPVALGNSYKTPNPDFFKHWDLIFEEARKQGLYIAFLINIGFMPADAASVKAFCEFLGSRYKNQPNIIWTLTHDWSFSESERAKVRAGAEGLVKGVSGQDIAWNQASPEWDKVMLQAGEYVTAGPSLHTEPYIDIVGSELNGGYRTERIYEWAKLYHEMKPRKPIVDVEPRLGGDQPIDDPLHMRRVFWIRMLMSQYSNNWAVSWINTLNVRINASMKIFSDFWQARDWWKFVPAIGALPGHADKGMKTVVAAKAEDGSALCVYFPDKAGHKVDLTVLGKGRELAASWFNPATAEKRDIAGKLSSDSVTTFTPPSGWDDALLWLAAGGKPTALGQKGGLQRGPSAARGRTLSRGPAGNKAAGVRVHREGRDFTVGGRELLRPLTGW